MKKLILLVVTILLLSLVLVGCHSQVIKPIESTIAVDKIVDLDENFIMGVDISSVVSLENSGVVFRNFDGEQQDIFVTLKQSGVNCVRVRLWNDPYDSNGNTYGGGVCDINTVVEIGKRATAQGISLFVDFHYSDFWADPSRQVAPKAWQNLSLDAKAEALRVFTTNSLNRLRAENINLAMVQLGNEITTGLAGESSWQNICTLLNAGVLAVRQFDNTLPIAMHFTNPEKGEQYVKYASNLSSYGVDYDVFASSYYPYWHGSLKNLTDTLCQISTEYDKDVMVAEVAYPKDYVDTDCHGNTITSDLNCTMPYAISIQGQATAVAETIGAIASIDRGIGVFYWEPAWLGVGTNWQSNSVKWEQFGSGWATRFAGEYDSEGAGKYYGGSAWENQAMFDSTGTPLESLCVFKYVYTGTVVK